MNEPLTKDKIFCGEESAGDCKDIHCHYACIKVFELKSALEYYIKRISNDKAWIESDDTIMEFSINQLKKAFPAIYGDEK